MTPNNPNPLEAAVLHDLLAGDHPVLAALRAQLTGLAVKARELTGVGFFTEFTARAWPATQEFSRRATILGSSSSVVNTHPLASVPSGKSPFGDVHATISGLQHGAGFLLYINDGQLRMLEGYTYDEPWPEEVKGFSLRYWDPTRKSFLASLG